MHATPKILTAFAACLTAVAASGAEPPKLTSLRTGYQGALSRATEPVQRTYLQELLKLKADFTKGGQLDAAMAVNEEIKKLPPDLVAAISGEDTNLPVRKLTIKASIDGDDKFILRDGKLSIEHGGWQKPTEITVNGEKWEPSWDGNFSAPFLPAHPPLAGFAGEPASVRKIDGRGEVIVVEQPSNANGQRLVFQLRDEGGGASEFDVRVSW